MAHFLFGIESPADEVVARCLQRAFVTAGHRVGICHCADDDPATAATVAKGALGADVDAALLFGDGAFALALAVRARHAGRPALRAQAGQSHLADHAADAWCVPNEALRQQLLREGLPDHIAVTGDLLAEALSTLPATPTAPLLLLALDHEDRGADLVEALAAAAQDHHLRIRAASAAAAANDVEGLATARTARCLVTDSVRMQALAAALRTPCVVLPGAALRQDLADSGAVLVRAHADDDVADAVARALAAPPPPAQPPTANAAAAVVAFAEHLLRGEATTVPVDDRLPSDGDASGRTLGEDEVQLVAQAIRSGTLNSTRGTFVARFERDLARWLGRKHVVACASGSAAVHTAIQALALQAGDEVITTPITDMGALTPILYEGALPVFADVDPRSLNVTADTIQARLTPRTRAIVVTHLFGLPCELDDILALAGRRGIPVIEDTAQAFGATHRGRKVGTFGALAAFSLQQGKHITTGEGGFVATDDDALARRVFLAVNKAWGYGDPKPDHYFPALNYRMTELQGAVGVAQLPKLDQVVRRRREVAAALREGLGDERALHLPVDPPHGTHSYWKFAFFVDPALAPGGAVALGKRMQQAGINCVPRYIQKPAFECALFQDWQRSPVTRLPLVEGARGDGAAPLFDRRGYPGAVRALDEVVVLPINERYQPHHVAKVVAGIRNALRDLQRG